MQLPSWLLNPLAGTVAGIGKAAGLPEMGFSEAIQDPTRGVNAPQLITNYAQGIAPNLSTGPGSPTQNPNIDPTDPNQTANNPQVLGLNTGGVTQAPAYDPNVDPNLVGQARGLAQNDMNTLNGLYASLNPMLSQYANDARGRIDQQYGDQMGANDKSYRSGVAGINAGYGARGAYDSSYRGNDIGTATDSYNQSNKSLGIGKDNAYGQIGSTIQGVQAQLANKPQFDLSQYNDVNALTQLHNQLGQHIASLQGTQQQLTPNGELVQKLNSITAPTSNLDATIKGQLDGLLKANTPAEAMTPLATAFLTRAGITDPAKQKQYFDYLQQIQQQQAPTPAANNLALQGA